MSDRLAWFKSSYSDSQGGNCLEAALDWHKSSYSDSQGGECLEVAPCPRTIHIRDSKLGQASPRLDIPSAAWADFLGHVRNVHTG
ncbi:DUF397 domain-containing protein [Streptomyces sp. TS71-3]|uniref:DUF397 domain-containing protein n=1 Tax=Streptomyces sp. TS71-3 TaxID=2733862 RepID=UPI001B289A0E|nr:DUF397 domain-containing protein [Streptomyces sp. TS71-3]GHJ35046.1 toxin [Streptomyces sp. TS71-3]